MFTYEEKREELKRELDRREMLYPAHMRAKLLSGHDARRRIDLLKEIISDYEDLHSELAELFLTNSGY